MIPMVYYLIKNERIITFLVQFLQKKMSKLNVNANRVIKFFFLVDRVEHQKINLSVALRRRLTEFLQSLADTGSS